MRAFRRVARLVHPDKCGHPQAKEAFQRLLLSSKSLKSNNGSSIYSIYIIRVLIKNRFATHTAATKVPHGASSYTTNETFFGAGGKVWEDSKAFYFDVTRQA